MIAVNSSFQIEISDTAVNSSLLSITEYYLGTFRKFHLEEVPKFVNYRGKEVRFSVVTIVILRPYSIHLVIHTTSP